MLLCFGICVAKGWKYAYLLFPTLLIIAWALDRSAAPSRAERELLDLGPVDLVAREYRFETFVRTVGPLKWEKWIRTLDRDRKAQAELFKLAGGKPWASGTDIPEKEWDRVILFINSHRDLRRRVEAEWGNHLVNMSRRLNLEKRVKVPAVKDQEWKELYGKLCDLLKGHGRLGWSGEGDFLLVDDQYQEPGHKIELWNPDVLTKRLVAEVQAALQGWQNEWSVMILLVFDKIDPGLEVGALVVWADRVDEDFDRKHYAEVLGPRFHL
jgi:hypothetical protein